MSIRSAINQLQVAIQFDFVEETMNIINENTDVIKEMLRIQLESGKDGNGDPVTVFGREYYSKETFFRKKLMSGLAGKTDVITNYMSGAFYSMLTVKTSGTTFEINSDVEYFGEIIAQSGDTIMELNQEHLQQFHDEILMPQLIERYNQFQNGI